MPIIVRACIDILQRMDDFRAILARLGWSKVKLGQRLGVDPTTVSRWGDDPPQYVREYLRVVLLAKEMLGD